MACSRVVYRPETVNPLEPVYGLMPSQGLPVTVTASMISVLIGL
jgi:hypothetical protein